jgi:hypothetical protein
MDMLVTTYVLYLLVSIGLTVWVGRTLSRSGQVFLVDVFSGNEELTRAVNHLLVVGFYLVNFGFVVWFLRTADTVVAARDVFETLSVKIGTVLVVLGVLHLANVWVFNKLRRRSRTENQAVPPVEPTGFVGAV